MSAKTISAAEWRQRLLVACQRVIDNADRLSQADRDLGDGDHGVTMARGFSAAKTALGAAPVTPGGDLAVVGAKLMGAGGTAGIVFGTWFTSSGRAIGAKQVDGPVLAEAMGAAAQAVRNRAKASPGDKTMLDALLPAAEALRAAANQGAEEALRQAAAAAAAGAEATRHMTARMGRASAMGERAIGFIDPGALSVSIIFEGLAAQP